MSAPRLRSDFWIAAHRRRAEAAGAYVAVARHGADEAGAIFVAVEKGGGRVDLYGPAPQALLADQSESDRLFCLVAIDLSDGGLQKRLEQEIRFDPDLWLIEVADREGRSFLNVAQEGS
jgi:hypothetical protein